MHKLLIVSLITLFLTGCATSYRTLERGSYIINENNSSYIANDDLLNDGHYPYTYKVFVNDSLNIVLVIPYSIADEKFSLGTESLDKVQKRILSLTKVNPKKDQILFANNRNMIVLRKSDVDLTGYRAFHIQDTVINGDTPVEKGDFFRKTFIHKPSRMIVYNDLIPSRDDYLAVATYSKPYISRRGEVYGIDPTNPDDMIFFNRIYMRTLKHTRENARYIYYPKIYKNKLKKE